MTNDPRIIRVETETKLERCILLKRKIKELTAELTMLSEECIATYFYCNALYQKENGVVLATYKSHESSSFKKEKFLEHFPELEKQVQQFTTKSLVWRFDLKY